MSALSLFFSWRYGASQALSNIPCYKAVLRITNTHISERFEKYKDAENNQPGMPDVCISICHRLKSPEKRGLQLRKLLLKIGL